MVRLLRLNKNLDAKGLQNPGVDEAERDAVNIGHGVGGQGGQALDDNLSKVGCDDGGHQGDEQTVDDAGDNGAAATAHCIGKDGGGTTMGRPKRGHRNMPMTVPMVVKMKP